jgi:hypothetical protein
MNANVVFKDHSAEFLRALREAQGKALRSGAMVLKNAVKRGLRGGYTSGDFTTGHAMRSITIGVPQFDDNGGSIQVGTPLLYPLFWEIGHHNIFTRRFERVQVWEPAFKDSRLEVLEVYSRMLRSAVSGTAAASVAEEE